MSIFDGLIKINEDKYSSMEDYGDSIPQSYFEDGRHLTLLSLGSSALTETFASLESLHDVVSSRLADGGLTTNEAAILNNSIKGVLNNVSADRVERNVVSVEAFSTKGGRQNQTYLAMEAIGDTLGKWWDKIKQFIRSWVAKVMDFYQKYISAIGRLPEACDKLIAKIEASDKEKADEQQLEISAKMLRNLTKEDDKVEVASIKSGFGELEDGVKTYTKDSKLFEIVDKVITNLSELSDYTNSDKVLSTLAGLTDCAKETTGGTIAGGDKRYTDNQATYTASATVLGKKRLVTKIRYSETVKDKSVGSLTPVSVSVLFDDYKDNLKLSDNYKIKPIDKGSMVSVLEAVKSLAKEINAASPEIRKKGNDVKKLLDEADKIYERVNDAKESDGDNKGKVKVADETGDYTPIKNETDPKYPGSKYTAGGTTRDPAKYESVKNVQSLLKFMVTTTQSIMNTGNFMIDQSGSSAKSAYDLVLMSFKNLKD